MGFLSVLTIQNDDLHRLSKMSFGDVWNTAEENTYFKNNSSFSAKMAWNQHADTYCLMLVGCYSAEPLVTAFAGHGGPVDRKKMELTLLKDLASKHGFNLTKKPRKRTKGNRKNENQGVESITTSSTGIPSDQSFLVSE